MALALIPREGLVVLQKKRLEHLKAKETGNANGRFWPKCVRDVAKACPRDVPGSPLGKLLGDSVKLQNAYLFAIRSSKLADGEPELVTAARLFERLLRSEPAVPPFQFAADDLQHVASWRSLYPAGSQLTALLLIGLLAFLTKRHQGSLPGKPPTLQLLRERYRSIPQSVPPSKVDAALLSIYTQQMQEQSRVTGSHILEAHARGATIPAGPPHATTGRPPLTGAEKERPIRFATREAFEPTPELWMHGDDDHRPTSIGIPACAHCRSWLFDTESCPACLDGKLVAAFAHKPPGEEMGRFEIVPLSTRHDGPIVTEEQKKYRVYVPFDPAEKAKTTEARKATMPAEQPWCVVADFVRWQILRGGIFLRVLTIVLP